MSRPLDPEVRRNITENRELPLFRESQGEQSFAKFESAHARKSDPVTSHQAAAKITNPGPVRDKILHVLGNCPRTDEQIAERYSLCVEKFGWPKCSPSGLRSRRSELVALGFVEDSGKTDKTAMGNDAIVWRLVSGRAK